MGPIWRWRERASSPILPRQAVWFLILQALGLTTLAVVVRILHVTNPAVQLPWVVIVGLISGQLTIANPRRR